MYMTIPATITYYAKLFAPRYEQPRKRGEGKRDATKNLNGFGYGGIRAAAS
jgi:hypothetical protein